MFDVFYIGVKPNLFPHETEVSSIAEAHQRSCTRYCWLINYLTDYSEFDFLWEPVPWEAHQAHVWPSQHQENGGTWLLPKHGFTEVNRAHSTLQRYKKVPVVAIDHGNGLACTYDHKTRYISDYLGTIRRAVSKLNDEYVWVVSSVCDYTDFDWTWHPSEWQHEMLHVFPSDSLKFGDTFYVHVPTFLDKSKNLALLEWFDTIHFVDNISVPRLPVPVVQHAHDSQVTAIMQHDFSHTPVVQFSRYAVAQTVHREVNLWRQETKAVIPLSPGASTVLVPREAKNFIKTQVYDYPVIDKTHKLTVPDPLLDIVFISNGEPVAEMNWEWLQSIGVSNTVRRVDGVNGRVAAYHAAANASTTPWFFAVFAKLQVNEHFDFTWHPDCMQQPKHYIFHALNPVNDLEYGHQAMIAYNKDLVLANSGKGLDFTLDSAHEVVPLLSGTALYHYDAWTCWRTAFRETLKLIPEKDIESQYRLKKWLSPSTSYWPTTDTIEWSQIGALDAVEYYNSVNGEFEELKKSYDWEWLASYAFVKHTLLPSQ